MRKWRMAMMDRGTAAVTIAAAAALIGCAAEREIRTAPPSDLTAAKLRTEGLALASVTVVDEVEQVRPALVAAFEQTLAAERPDLPLQRADSVKAALGLPAYRRLVMAYQSFASLKESELAEFKGAVGARTRYLLLARVEKNSVRETGRLRTGGLNEQFPSMALTIARDARIRFTIFDLQSEKVAFEAQYASSSENAPPDSLFKIPPRVSGGPPRAPDPTEPPPDTPAPELAAALLEGYKAFAADLPR